MGCLVIKRSRVHGVMTMMAVLTLIASASSQAVASVPRDLGVSSQDTSTVLKIADVLSKPEVTDEHVNAQWAATSFIDRHASQWGVSSNTVRYTKTIPGAAGLSTLRFVQTVSDMDVLGTVVALTMDQQLRLVSYDVNVLQVSEPLPLVATLSEAQAQQALQSAVAHAQGVEDSQVSVVQLHAVVAHSALTQGIPQGLHVGWSSWTSIDGRPDTAAVSVLDDRNSALLYSSPLARHITYTPNVCDLQSASPSDYSAQSVALGSSGLIRVRGGYMYINSVGNAYPLCGINYAGRNTPSSAKALANIDSTWRYFKSVLGVDINAEKWLGNISPTINGDRNPRISAFVNVCEYDSTAGYSDCPNFGNAFWSPWSAPASICRTGACSGIFMGLGYDKALDVIAHELTHGVTFSVAFQDGFSDTSDAYAMSEGLSDIFGEAAERLSPTSEADPTWQVGENIDAVDSGAVRTMKTGTTFTSRTTSISIPAITTAWQKRDGHTNSGPLNRFAWLISNGATVGSTTVQPLGTVPTDGICHALTDCTGISRMSVLMYQALPSLTSSSSYFDLGQAVMNACQTLVTNKTTGFDAAACTNVGRALRLTGISRFTIKNVTTKTSIQKSKPITVVASAKSYAGAPVSLQPMKLEQLVHGKWVVVQQADAACKHYCTNALGRVSFSVKWTESARYRIAAYSNYGAMQAQTPAYFLRVY